MLEAGVTKSDIAQLVRSKQAEFLFELCYMMDDPGAVDGNKQLVDWSYVELGAEGTPGRAICGLHESVLQTDPTGREVRPKPNGG